MAETTYEEHDNGGYKPKLKIDNNLVEIRTRYGIMQQDLSIVGNFSLNTITGIEKHGNKPGVDTRHKLVVSLNALIAEKGFSDIISERDIWPDEPTST